MSEENIEAGDLVYVIEHPGRKLVGIASDGSGGFVKVTVSNGSNDWHETCVDQTVDGKDRFQMIQLALDLVDG